MSDHFSGPRAMAHPHADITDVYAFPSPERPGNLVIAMNVHPNAPADAAFSDAMDFQLRGTADKHHCSGTSIRVLRGRRRRVHVPVPFRIPNQPAHRCSPAAGRQLCHAKRRSGKCHSGQRGSETYGPAGLRRPALRPIYLRSRGLAEDGFQPASRFPRGGRKHR